MKVTFIFLPKYVKILPGNISGTLQFYCYLCFRYIRFFFFVFVFMFSVFTNNLNPSVLLCVCYSCRFLVFCLCGMCSVSLKAKTWRINSTARLLKIGLNEGGGTCTVNGENEHVHRVFIKPHQNSSRGKPRIAGIIFIS